MAKKYCTDKFVTIRNTKKPKAINKTENINTNKFIFFEALLFVLFVELLNINLLNTSYCISCLFILYIKHIYFIDNIKTMIPILNMYSLGNVLVIIIKHTIDAKKYI